MATPLVSVKMITYNHKSYIRQAIECVLAQKTNFTFELVIGEDYSTDGTREIVFDYAKRYPDIIRVITSEQNVGMKQNGKRTADACRGKYIAYCEGDDYWHNPQKLQKQVDFLEKNSNYEMVISDCNIFINHRNKLKVNYNFNKGVKASKDLTLEDAFGYGDVHIFTCTAVINKETYDRIISGDPYLHQSDTFMMGDVQLWIELVLKYKVFYIAECQATYRVLQVSASFSKDQIKMIHFWASGYEMRLYLCRKYNISGEVLKRTKLNYNNLQFRLAFYESNKKLAAQLKDEVGTISIKNYIYLFGVKNKFINIAGIKLLSLYFNLKKIKDF